MIKSAEYRTTIATEMALGFPSPTLVARSTFALGVYSCRPAALCQGLEGPRHMITRRADERSDERLIISLDGPESEVAISALCDRYSRTVFGVGLKMLGDPFKTERRGTSGRDNNYDTQHAGEPERRAVRQLAGGAFFRDRRAAPVLVVRMSRTVNWEGAWKTIQTSA